MKYHIFFNVPLTDLFISPIRIEFVRIIEQKTLKDYLSSIILKLSLILEIGQMFVRYRTKATNGQFFVENHGREKFITKLNE